MIKLFTEEDYLNFKELHCQCIECGTSFIIERRKYKYHLNNANDKRAFNFCSKLCKANNFRKRIDVNCANCNKIFSKKINQIDKTKNNFCSCSCAATFNNKNKTTGNKRSKLEKYLEIELIKQYPNLDFHFNRKDTINSELDIYIPSLKLAFELNGLFHYEPIFGDNKLNQIKNNDNRKFQACLECGIELCIIDTSQQKYFKEQTSQKFLKIICDVINKNVITLL